MAENSKLIAVTLTEDDIPELNSPNRGKGGILIMHSSGGYFATVFKYQFH